MTKTDYAGPVVISEHGLEGRNLRLVRPADPDRMLDHPSVLDWNRRDDYMPYWAYLWPGATLLAEAVLREPGLDRQADSTTLPPESACSRDVLEIGCGLGLAGLAALARGRSVVFTDYDEAAFPFIARSAAENQFDPSRFETRRLDWRELPDEQFALILGSDVLYEHRLVPLVADLLAQMLAPSGLGLIATPLRVAAEGFPAAAAARGLSCAEEALLGQAEDGSRVRGRLFRVSHRTG
jgi:predicted nicotinamide N-methyase